MYVFTVLFVIGPILYMFLLSFLQRAEVWGVDFSFTLDNYKRILEPLYLKTFKESFQLAFLSTALVILIGYPYGYFMARMSAAWKKRMMLLIMVPFWTSGSTGGSSSSAATGPWTRCSWACTSPAGR